MSRAARRVAGLKRGTSTPTRPATGLPTILDTFTGGYNASMYLTQEGTIAANQLSLAGSKRFDSVSRPPTYFTSAYLKWTTTSAEHRFMVWLNTWAARVAIVLHSGNDEVYFREEDSAGEIVGSNTILSGLAALAPTREMWFKIENDGSNWKWYANPGASPPASGSWTQRKSQVHQATVVPGTNNANVTIKAGSGGLTVDNLGVYF